MGFRFFVASMSLPHRCQWLEYELQLCPMMFAFRIILYVKMLNCFLVLSDSLEGLQVYLGVILTGYILPVSRAVEMHVHLVFFCNCHFSGVSENWQ